MSIEKKLRHTFVFLSLLFVIGNSKVLAQLSAIHDFERVDSVLLTTETNDTLHFPFAGGLNSCQFMNMDINLDGTEDLLVFDRHGYRILPFLSTVLPPFQYKFAPEFVRYFPVIEQWIQVIDYNNDGKKDIFTYTTGGIKVYRNDSDAELKFTKVTQPFLLSQQGLTLTNILVTYADYPAIVDIDVDGDYDIITFWGLGSFLELHRNTSVEQFGNTDSLSFEKVSNCWGHFAEGNEDNTIILDTCPVRGKEFYSDAFSDDPKHTGSTLLIQDLNNDGLPDITIGDVDFSTLIHLTNGGTPAEAKMISQTNNFPNSSEPVNMNSFPGAMLADVNFDGKDDLLVSPFDPSLVKSENQQSVSLYINNGTNTQPDYSLASESFIQDQMLDLGSGAYPVFFDFNKDGLMDVLVGNYGYYDTCIYTVVAGLQCTFTAQVALLLNIGTAEKPAFKLVDRNIAQLDELQMQSLIPALADMDGDGDTDLVCGNSKGKFVYCENMALAGQTADFKLVDPAWHGIDVGDFSAPQLFDIDKDGLNDLICGKRNGTLSFYKNTGTKTESQFVLESEMLGGVDITNTQLSNFGFSVPCFYQDKNAETILFTASEFGEIFVYDQIDNNLGGNFRLLGTIPGISEGWRTGVAIGNWNSDSLTDMLVGNYSGGLGLFLGKPDKIFGINNPMGENNILLAMVPNPACSTVLVSAGISGGTAEYLSVYSVDGRFIRNYIKPQFPLRMDVSDLQNGVYLISVFVRNQILTGKLIVCR